MCVMGNTESMESQLAVIRSRAAPVRLPMPDPAELEERFSIALVSAPHSLPNTHTHTPNTNSIVTGLHCLTLISDLTVSMLIFRRFDNYRLVIHRLTHDAT